MTTQLQSLEILQVDDAVLLKYALKAIEMTKENNDLEIMKKANKLIKGNKIDYDPTQKKLIWLYYPKLFKKLLKKTVDSKIRKVK